MDIAANRYKLVYAGKGHPRGAHSGYVHEHVRVMELHIGRYLQPGESVHHLDGNKHNNAIENLVLCASESEHQRTYHRDRASALGKRPKYHLRAFAQDKVEEIRALLDTAPYSYRAVGRMYGVTHHVISKIARGVYEGAPCG